MLFAILFFILRLPSLFEPYWYGDEGIYLTLGQGIRHGFLLYQQIHDNKPPTLYYLAALAQNVFTFRLILALFMIPTIYFFSRLAKKFLSPRLAYFATFFFLILSSIPLIEGTIANAEVFMLLPTILAVLIFLNSDSKKSLFFSGLLLGLAFTIKVPVAAEFAFLALWLLIFSKEKIKKVIIFSLAFILPVFLYALYFYFKGAIVPFLSAALLQNFAYLSSWATGTQQASVSSGGLIWRALFLLIALFVFYLSYQQKYINKNSLFILSWFAAALFGALLSGRPYPHYLIEVLPPLSLLLFSLSQGKKISLVTLCIFIYSLIHFQFYYYPVFSYYKNFYAYAFNKKTLSEYQAYFSPDMNDIYSLAEKIKSLTSDSDKIFVWGDQSFIYPLANRLPSTKYLVAYHVVDFQAYDLTLSQLKINTPQIIVYYPQSSRPYPKLDEFISAYYFLTDQIGQAYIFQLR